MLSEGYKLREDTHKKLMKKERKRDVIEEQQNIIRTEMNHFAETFKLITPEYESIPSDLEEQLHLGA